MRFYQVEDIMSILGVCRSKAYKVIQTLNKELQDRGYLTVPGKVSKKFFKEKFYDDLEPIAAKKRRTS